VPNFARTLFSQALISRFKEDKIEKRALIFAKMCQNRAKLVQRCYIKRELKWSVIDDCTRDILEELQEESDSEDS